MSLNMKKQYRAEIRIHKAAAKKIHRDRVGMERAAQKEIAQHKRAISQIFGSLKRAVKRCDREQKKVATRILILEGRLA